MSVSTRVLETVARTLLPGFLRSRKWFSSGGHDLARIELGDHAVVEGGVGRPTYVYAVFEVFDHAGDAETYAIPLSLGTGGASGADSIIGVVDDEGRALTVADALYDERFIRTMLAWIARAATLPTAGGGSIVGTRAAAFGALLGGAIEEIPVRQVRGERSTAIAISPGGHDKMLMRVLRHLESGPSPAIEIGALLSRVGFRHTPHLLGDLSYVPARSSLPTERVTLAILREFVPSNGDGWKHALRDLREHLASPSDNLDLSPVRQLGEVVGALHVALATERRDPAFAPEPAPHDAFAELVASLATRLLDLARDLDRPRDRLPEGLGPTVAAIVANAAPHAERLRALPHPGPMLQQRIHGDLHLGRVLRTTLTSGIAPWSIVDFEGAPADQREKSSPLRDVAGMVRSFDYATHAAIAERDPARDLTVATRRGGAFRDAAREAFTTGWHARIERADLPVIPAGADAMRALLELHELDRALDELAYELDHRPDWAGIPLRGIERIVMRG